jgi:hypothetical protein
LASVLVSALRSGYFLLSECVVSVRAKAVTTRENCGSIFHDWDGPYSVSVFCAASNVARKRATKQHAVEELVKTLRSWAASRNSFEEDMAIEIRESGRILMEDPFVYPMKPQMGDEGTPFKCPNCTKTAIYQLFDLRYRRD